MKNRNEISGSSPRAAGEYGKFDTAGDLLAAYNALESEFTKKCQSLKRLQAQLDLMSAQAQAAPPATATGEDGAPAAAVGASQDRSDAEVPAPTTAEPPDVCDGAPVEPDDPTQAEASESGKTEQAEKTEETEKAETAEHAGTDGAATVAVLSSAGDGADEMPARRVLEIVARNAAEYAELLSALPEIMDACVARYKQKLIDGRNLGASPAGMAVVMPAKRPRTLYEAKLLADELLGGL